MATKKTAAKKAQPKAATPKATPAPKADAPQVKESAPPAEQTDAPQRAPAQSELGPIDGVLINVLWADDKYVVTNITNRPVTVREAAHKSYYASELQAVTLEPGDTYSFKRRDGVRLEPSTI